MKIHSEDVKTLELDIEGPAVVTAGDIIHDSEIEIKILMYTFVQYLKVAICTQEWMPKKVEAMLMQKIISMTKCLLV